MAYAPVYETWFDWPTTSTPITAAHLQNSDDWIGTIANGEDGDNLFYANSTIGKKINIAHGTNAAPDTSSTGPVLKVCRTMSVSSDDFSGDGFEPCSVIIGVGKGLADNDGQVVGVTGSAHSISTLGLAGGGDDACGIYGIGRISGSGTGVGIGGFFNGRRENSSGNACGVEISCDNRSTANTYDATQFNQTTGVWLHGTGVNTCSVGLAISNPFSVKFDVGIGFLSQNTGGVVSASIRDDSQSTTSYDLNGTHTNGFDLEGATISGAGIAMGTHTMRFTERGSDASAPSSNQVVIYAKDNGSGKTQLVARFPTGAVQQIAIEP